MSVRKTKAEQEEEYKKKIGVRDDKGGYTLVTLPRIVTPYGDSVDETRARVTYQKLVTR